MADIFVIFAILAKIFMGIEKKWVVREQGNPAAVRQLAQELGIDQVLANLLVQRGIDTFAKAREFFRPDLGMLHDPFLMKDMEQAVDRMDRAIRDKERILVYGDYDVDGTTAVSTPASNTIFPTATTKATECRTRASIQPRSTDAPSSSPSTAASRPLRK